MLVYVLTTNYVYYEESENNVVGVYQSIEDAYKQMKREMERARDDFKSFDTEEDSYVEGDMSWSIWEPGNYSRCKIDIQIVEKYLE